MSELTVTYTYDEYSASTTPYEELYRLRSDPFRHQQALEATAKHALSVGYRGFKKTYERYVQALQVQEKILAGDRVTDFEGQPIELDAAGWTADETGIYKQEGFAKLVACTHPIMPIERLRNLDTNSIKVKLAYRRGGRWSTLVAPKEVLSSANKVTELAHTDISVTSRTAPAFVQYIADVMDANYSVLPERKSIGRLGYIKGEGFSPYVDSLEFDGEDSYREIFESVTEHGDLGEWYTVVEECRKMSTAARLMISASLASCLVAPLGTLPFFVHLWGGTANGKTVALMAAASMWADPEIGTFVKTFNATEVGFERTAAFLNHLPLCIDELQLVKDERGRSAFNVYQLAQGAGRTRGNRNGGVDVTPRWSNCFLSTGESPINSVTAAAGAINRVIDIDCSTSDVTVDGHRVSNILRQNYGFGGREFVRHLYDKGGVEYAAKVYQEYVTELNKSDTTDKQAMAAALLLTADRLACEWLFPDAPLTVSDIAHHLATKNQVSSGERAYLYFRDWAVQNMGKLSGDTNGEIYGVTDVKYTYIIRSVFDRACEGGGFDPRAVLSHFKQQGYIECSGKGFTKIKRILGVPTHCVWFKVAKEDADE